jgi:hypothetical protein
MLNEFTYSVFGLALRSNLSIPGLETAPISSNVPVVGIHLRESPDWTHHPTAIAQEDPFYVSSFLGPAGEPALRIWRLCGGAFLHLVYYNGLQFWLDREGNYIWGNWPDELSNEAASTFLLGPVLGLLLRLRGVACLHASAVAIGGRAVAFVGSAGAGKSTTAAAFARRGHSLLSDDIVALSEVGRAFRVAPAYPYLSLWPESVDMLYGSPEALPRFIANWDKRYLAGGTDGVRFEESSLPLGAIYLLDERAGDPAPLVEPVPPQTSLISLIANTYATNTLDSQMRAMEFEVLGRLVSAVPVRKVRAHEDPSRIDNLCRLVCADFDSLASRSALAAGQS